MIWDDTISGSGRRKKRNRRRAPVNQPLLTVQARISDQKKARMHKWGAILALLVALAGIGWVAKTGYEYLGRVLFSGNELFAIRELDLRSDGVLRAAHIREYARVDEGDNLFAVDIRELRRQLENIPLIQSAEIRRQLPDTLVIRVSERVPLARLGIEDGQYHLAVDREGHVLGPSARSPRLPAITGYRATGLRPGSIVHDPLFADALKVVDLCDRTRLGQRIKIRSINVSDPEFLDLRLVDGEQVLLNRNDIEMRLQMLEDALQTARNRGDVLQINLTGDTNIPITFR